MSTYVVIDGGKSGLRVLATTDDGNRYATGSGFAYSAEDDGVEQILASLASAVGSLTLPGPIDGICAGLTGIPGEDADRQRLSVGIQALVDGPVVLTEDSVLAHAGALGGPGAVLCVGTGTTALAVASDGRYGRVDGWGPQLGDRGSAFAVGLAGLRAAAADLDGVGPRTSLTSALPILLGGTDLASLQAYYRSPDHLARTAGFAQDVLAAALDDEVAHGICVQAAADLAAAARSACDRANLTGVERRVSYSGRVLAPDNPMHVALTAALDGIGLPLVEPAGGPLDAGVSLLVDPGPYAPLLWRCPSEGS